MYQLMPTTGKSCERVKRSLPSYFSFVRLRYSRTDTDFEAIANDRPIRRLCWTSPSSRSFSVTGDPIANSTGPGITTIVWPCVLTYHCSVLPVSLVSNSLIPASFLSRPSPSFAHSSFTRVSHASCFHVRSSHSDAA